MKKIFVSIGIFALFLVSGCVEQSPVPATVFCQLNSEQLASLKCPSCPGCPASSCSLSCNQKFANFTACHFPDGVLFRQVSELKLYVLRK